MSSRALLLILGVLLLLSLVQGGIRRRRRLEAPGSVPVVRECERKPKLYLCKHDCKADKDCQADSVCCSAYCGNVCLKVLEESTQDYVHTAVDSFYAEFGFDENVVSTTPATSRLPVTFAVPTSPSKHHGQTDLTSSLVG